jgi:hypothetical protein
MVPVVRVADGFHARVVAARLGSEGILTQLRGGIDNPYPMGPVEVLVGEDDFQDALDLLMADDIESAFPDDGDGDPPSPRRSHRIWVVLALAALLTMADVLTVAGLWR